MESRVKGVQELARQWKARLGVEGLRELARDIQASREAGRFVSAGEWTRPWLFARRGAMWPGPRR
ncbi:hypothetical protein ACN28S_62695 [Cystobacter fuscus]